MKKKMNYYIDNNELLELIIKYKKSESTRDKIINKLESERLKPLSEEEKDSLDYPEKMSGIDLNRLGSLILLLVERIATRSNFINYTYKEDMKSHACFSIWKGLKTFDPKRSNSPFSYFTQTTFNAFLYIINKQKLTRERQKIYQEHEMEKIKEMEGNESLKLARKKFTREFTSNKLFYE